MLGLFSQPYGNDAAVRDSHRGRLRRVRHADLTIDFRDDSDTIVVLNLSDRHRVRTRIDGRWASTNPTVGTVTVLPAGTHCHVEVSGECRIILARVSTAVIAAARAAARGGLVEPVMRVSVNDNRLAHALCRCAISDEEGDLVEVGLALLEPATPSNAACAARGGIPPRRLRRVVDLVDADPSAGMSLGRLAAEAGTSVFHFAHAFRATTGVTPHQWIVTRRVAQAMRLLDTLPRLGVDEIAKATGFSHASHLSRATRKCLGISPAQIRSALLA